MMEDIKEDLNSLKSEATEYAKLRYDLLQLKTIDLASNTGARLMAAFFLALVGLGILIFSGFGLAFYLGSVFDNYSIGFFIVTGIILVLTIIGVIFNEALVIKPFRRLLLRWIIKKKK
jgi:hypothetical protein